MFGAVNGAGTTIDMRGFGASAASNTLVLLNGRKLTDIDLAGVDFSAIPRESIERIEITRGNAGAVLYGDGAVGGVINIVTKSGENIPPSARISGGFGSFNQREGNLSANGSYGGASASVFANAIDSDGYRVNNRLQQRDVTGDFRAQVGGGTAYLYIAADDQRLGLPGSRHVTLTTSELVTDPTGAQTPTAFGNKQGVNAILGYSRMLTNGIELIVDGSVRQKEQQTFSEISGFAITDNRKLDTFSFTPRMNIQGFVFGMPTKVTTGLDFYDSTLKDDPRLRAERSAGPPVRAGAAFGRHVLAADHRHHRPTPTSRSAHAASRPGSPRAICSIRPRRAPSSMPRRCRSTARISQYAFHLGAEHRFNPVVAVFGRVGHSFRTPNVDERIGVLSFPVDFRLQTQTSNDAEGGVRLHLGPVEIQSSVYDMELLREIHFDPSVFANINLDPTRRYGTETSATWRALENLTLRAGFAYTRSVFRDGPNAGNDVPLVSRWTATGSASWNIWQKILVADAVVRYVGERRMDNDQANFQPLIPAQPWSTCGWAASTGTCSTRCRSRTCSTRSTTTTRSRAPSRSGPSTPYPQPGRVIMGRLGLKFP